MLLTIIGLVFLAYPCAQLPQLIRHKRQQGTFFTQDFRFLVTKQEGGGNNLNMKNRIAFFANVVIGIVLVVAGILEIIR